jgi:hypothetical protein
MNYPIYDLLKRFADGEFNGSTDIRGDLNGALSRLHDEMASVQESAIAEAVAEAEEEEED